MTKKSMKVSTTTVRSIRIELSRQDILGFLKDFSIPRDAGVYVQVPGGGDWSNESLDIGDNCPVIVTWSERSESDDQAS